MASSIPTALKSADIARFAQRAGQVEKAKPAIAYWCKYKVDDTGKLLRRVQATTG